MAEEKEQYEKDLELAKSQVEGEEDENEEEEESQEPEEQQTEIENEARAEGWVPLEEWTGPEDQWVDAETFVKRGREILPIVNSKLSKTQKELQELREKFSRMDKASKDAMRRQQENHMKELEEARREAFESQDYDRFRQVEKEMNELQENDLEKEEGSDDVTKHPAVQDFLVRNPWYGQDEDLTAYTDAISSKLDLPDATPEERFKVLEDRVKKAFPHKFDEQKRTKKTPTVESGRTDNRTKKSSSKKKSYDDLPDEAKKACDEFVDDLGIMSTDEYVDSYFSQ